MIFYAQAHEESKPAIVEADDSLSAAVRLARQLELKVGDKFYVVSKIDAPETISLDVSLWETVVDWCAVAFPSDAAFWQVMTPSRKGPIVPDLTEWWRENRDSILALEESLNQLFGLGQIGSGRVRELFEVQSNDPYVITKVV